MKTRPLYPFAPDKPIPVRIHLAPTHVLTTADNNRRIEVNSNEAVLAFLKARGWKVEALETRNLTSDLECG